MNFKKIQRYFFCIGLGIILTFVISCGKDERSDPISMILNASDKASYDTHWTITVPVKVNFSLFADGTLIMTVGDSSKVFTWIKTGRDSIGFHSEWFFSMEDIKGSLQSGSFTAMTLWTSGHPIPAGGTFELVEGRVPGDEIEE